MVHLFFYVDKGKGYEDDMLDSTTYSPTYCLASTSPFHF